jgi:hypothetical protein
VQTSIAQSDTLNKLNSKGKKTGYWKVLLNDRADPVDSLSDAYFYGIEQWDNGEKVFRFFKHFDFPKVVYDGILPEKGKPRLIDGTFKWYDSKGLLRNEEIYKNGHPFFIKSYNWENENTMISLFNEVLYFDRKFENIPGTYYYEEYGYNGRLIGSWWFRKGKRGWRVYKIQ